jgi:hypothetical protein
MIIVQLIGGLGNQLFQYATGRRLAHIHNAEIKLDITPFETYKLHHYSLQHFNIIEEFADASEVARLKHTGISRKLIRLIDKLRLPIKLSHVIERTYAFDPAILRLGPDVYLEGFWQTAKYFDDIIPLLRQELTVKMPPDQENAAMADQIQSVTGVSLHVRRADYATDAAALNRHGLMPLSYYGNAVNYIAERVENLNLFMFSDDPGWVQKNLQFKHPITYVTHNRADRNYEDLRLMSLCQHHIIANSSFSWWGAWLGSNPTKIVVAPHKWANDLALNTPDRLPAAWKKM